jgi:hypothetical protein
MVNENLPTIVKELFDRLVHEAVLHREQEAAKLGDKRVQILAEFLTVAYEKGAAFTSVLLGAGRRSVRNLGMGGPLHTRMANTICCPSSLYRPR